MANDWPVLVDNKDNFSYNKMARYSWVYIIAPLIAALFAGLLARFHLKALEHKFKD